MPTGIQTTLTVWDHWGSLRGDPVPLLRGWWRRCTHWEQWGPLWWNYGKVADKRAPLVGRLSLTQTLQELGEREHTLWRARRAQRAVPSHSCKAGTQLAYDVQEVIWPTPIWQRGKQAERHTATSPSHGLESQSAIHLGFSSSWPSSLLISFHPRVERRKKMKEDSSQEPPGNALCSDTHCHPETKAEPFNSAHWSTSGTLPGPVK